MQTPYEKADELMNLFMLVYNEKGTYPLTEHEAKQCVEILCNEMINVLDVISIGESGTTKIDFGQKYFLEIKDQIQNL